MARKASSDRRDAALLHISQRLAETDGSITPAAMLRELKSVGQGYRKSDFLKDFAGIKGVPQKKPTPGQIKGGLISGLMRRKDIKKMPYDQQMVARDMFGRAIDAVTQTGENPRKGFRFEPLGPGTGIYIVFVAANWDDIEDLPDQSEIEDDVNIGNVGGIHIPALVDCLNQIYDRLT